MGDGVIFYIEIVYPTALIAVLCGIRFFGAKEKSLRRRNISIAVFWIVTLLISLLPGYFSAKIYTYGWQYGYFPGFVWDEAMELSSGYWISRILEIAIILAGIPYESLIRKEGWNHRRNLPAIMRKWQYWMMITVVVIFGVTYEIQLGDTSLQGYLHQVISIG
ncbi:MAG: hypothetical protein ACHQM6_10090, partial [Candidatus Kapaibacterium sp.]